MRDLKIELDKLSIQIREYQNQGDTIIFLHYGGANLEMWQGVTPYFEGKFHLVLIDLRGHGKSDKPVSGYHIDLMAEDVVGVMRELDLVRAHVIGSSMGAEVGLSMAANYPEQVHSLVCDGALHSEFGPYGLWEGSDTEYEEYAAARIAKIQAAPEEVYSSLDAYVAGRREIFAPHGMWNEIFEAVTRCDAIKLAEDAYVASWGRIAEDYTRHYLFYRFEDYYSRVSCPLLILPAAEMENGSRAEQVMFALKNLTPRGKISPLPGWVHPFGWMLTPKVVSEAVISFLGEITLAE